MTEPKRKVRKKRETFVKSRRDGKRSAHLQGRYNEATVEAHADILDMLAYLCDEKGYKPQQVLDDALRDLFMKLKNGEKLGGRIADVKINAVLKLVGQANATLELAQGILKKIENHEFRPADLEEARGQIVSHKAALKLAQENFVMQGADVYAGQISFSNDTEEEE